MKKFSMIVGFAALSMLGACHNNDDRNGNMGSMHDKNCHCSKCMDKANMGAMHDKNCACTKCTDMKKGNMGAVGEKKAGCCSEAKPAGSMGAVSEKKSGCCASGAAKTCTDAQKN